MAQLQIMIIMNALNLIVALMNLCEKIEKIAMEEAFMVLVQLLQSYIKTTVHSVTKKIFLISARYPQMQKALSPTPKRFGEHHQ